MPSEPTALTLARKKEWQALEAEGRNRSEIARLYQVSRQLVSKVLGSRPREIQNRQEIHIYVVPDLYKRAATIARGFGLIHHGGKTSGEGSVGRLVDKIGAGELVVIPAGEGDGATSGR